MFEIRSSETEFMDDFSCGGEVVEQTLQELHLINTWLGGNNVILSGLHELLFKNRSGPGREIIRIADLGCGGGDMLRLMAKWAVRNKLKVEIYGIDANPNIIAYARTNTSAFKEIRYLGCNIFSEEFKQMKFDVITCTLFCHHFDDENLIRLFHQLRSQTKIGIVVNDIHRHWFAYHSIKFLTALFSRSAMVKNDAKISVLRAFRKKELEHIFIQAGFTNFSILWQWAFRFRGVVRI